MTALTLETSPAASLTWPDPSESWGLTVLPDESTARVREGVWEASRRPDAAGHTHEVWGVDRTSATVAGIARATGILLGDLARYSTYSARWDGYDAEPFERALIRRAQSLALEIAVRLLREAIAPDLFTSGPAPDGSIDIELRRGRRRLFFIIYPMDQGSEVRALEQGEPRRVEPLGAGAVERWLSWLVR